MHSPASQRQFQHLLDPQQKFVWTEHAGTNRTQHIQTEY